MIQSGQHGPYHWVVARQLPGLREAVPRFHLGLRLCVSAFDSGAIHPSLSEQALGWTAHEHVMISPVIEPDLEIPSDQYDEWYVLSEAPTPSWKPEVFVNYGGFTLVPPEDIYKTYDPTWDRHGLDWLGPLQERFWDQLKNIRPASYIAMGENDIVVSDRRDFIDMLRSAAQPGLAGGRSP